MYAEMTTPQIIALAQEAFDSFQQIKRGEETITTYKDDAPEWIAGMTRKAHGEFFPDDYRYEWIQDACGAIADACEGSDLTEVGNEFADGVDIYTHDRLKWLASNLNRPAYCDEARSEGLAGPDIDIVELIGIGQYMERQEIFSYVRSAISDRAEEIEDESEEV